MVDPVYPSVLGVPFPLFDLAVLSNCDDVIFDYGTFGFWAAYLAGGVTIQVLSCAHTLKRRNEEWFVLGQGLCQQRNRLWINATAGRATRLALSQCQRILQWNKRITPFIHHYFVEATVSILPAGADGAAPFSFPSDLLLRRPWFLSDEDLSFRRSLPLSPLIVSGQSRDVGPAARWLAAVLEWINHIPYNVFLRVKD